MSNNEVEFATFFNIANSLRYLAGFDPCNARVENIRLHTNVALPNLFIIGIGSRFPNNSKLDTFTMFKFISIFS